MMLAGLLVLAAANVALADTMAHPSAPDPLLDGTPGPCAGLTAGADYVAGTDADGHPVPPADVGSGPVPLPETIAIPLHGAGGQASGGRNPATGGRPYVMLDGRKLAPLLNPPACH